MTTFMISNFDVLGCGEWSEDYNY